jgi:hypothetical protein
VLRLRRGFGVRLIQDALQNSNFVRGERLRRFGDRSVDSRRVPSFDVY